MPLSEHLLPFGDCRMPLSEHLMPFGDCEPLGPSTGMLPDVPIDELVEWVGRCQIVIVADVLPVRRRCVMSARQAGAVVGEAGGGCALAKPMAAHGHVNGWREGTA